VLFSRAGHENRPWDPFRSKLAAALLKGLPNPIQDGARVLYLGASTGTTVSHVSDLIGPTGIVFAVEPAPRVARELVERVATWRANVIPVMADARDPAGYSSVFGSVNLVYCDIAQPDQTEIALKNCHQFLAPDGAFLLVLKARSIDVTKEPAQVFREEVARVQAAGLRVDHVVRLDPFDRDHAMLAAGRPRATAASG
jgi:fibrillarin-like pre-rRNA processing protein